jgi:hypothetical protein
MRWLVDYVVVAPLMLMASLALGTLWHFAGRPAPALFQGALLMVWHGVMLYQTGLKKYYASGRQRFFYAVFAGPSVLATIAYAVGMVWKFW